MEDLLDWYIKDRVIFDRPIGDLSMKSIRQYNGRMVKLLVKGTAPVHVIIDARYVDKVPTNLLTLSTATSFLSHPALGWVMTVTTNSVVSFLAGMVPQIGLVKRYRVFSDLAQPFEFLKEHDKTLDWEAANNELLIESKV